MLLFLHYKFQVHSEQEKTADCFTSVFVFILLKTTLKLGSHHQGVDEQDLRKCQLNKE